MVALEILFSLLAVIKKCCVVSLFGGQFCENVVLEIFISSKEPNDYYWWRFAMQKRVRKSSHLLKRLYDWHHTTFIPDPHYGRLGHTRLQTW